MADLAIGSLFAGIGGLELGLERATGARTVWQVEADPWCRAVLAHHWPDAVRFDDVCTASALPAVDIMCGGFPCQDISAAGKGAGLDGARSGLWREFARLVGEGRPRVVVVENVAALATRGLSRVLSDLADLGYMGSWNVVTAASVGAPHLRRRLFIVAADADRVVVRDERWWAEAWARAAIPRLARSSRDAADADGTGREEPDLPAVAEAQGFAPRRAAAGRPLADADRVAGGQGRALDAAQVAGGRHLDRVAISPWCGWEPASPVRRVDDGIPEGVDRPRRRRLPASEERRRAYDEGHARRRRRPAADGKRLKALGNAVVPQVAEVVGRVVADVLEVQR